MGKNKNNSMTTLKGMEKQLDYTSVFGNRQRKDYHYTEGRAIAQAASRRLPTAAARAQIRVWSCGIL
jgi:hypothetical protein